jgi:hypothetical protein
MADWENVPIVLGYGDLNCGTMEAGQAARLQVRKVVPIAAIEPVFGKMGRDGAAERPNIEGARGDAAHHRGRAKRREPSQLQKLSAEVSRIARTLAGLSEDDSDTLVADMADKVLPEAGLLKPGSVDPALIRAVIRARRLRDQYLGPDLFADPAWDMMLDLTAARLEGRAVAVSSLCIAAAVPATTALRWIKQLTDTGFFRRVADPDDGRRIFIELTDETARRMHVYVQTLLQAGMPGV